MPQEVLLHLRPLHRTHTEPSPRQLHGLVSTVLGESDSEHKAADKPWSAALTVDDPRFVLRIGWLGSHTAPEIGTTQVRLGSSAYAVEAQERIDVPFESLVAAPAWEVGLEMLTPTWFMRGGSAFPFPDPLLVFSRLAQRWNQYAPEHMAIPTDLRDALLDQLVLLAWSGSTAPFDIGRGVRPGFVGRMVAGVGSEAAPETASLLAALTRFASLAGVGAQTTFGAGRVRSIT